MPKSVLKRDHYNDKRNIELMRFNKCILCSVFENYLKRYYKFLLLYKTLQTFHLNPKIRTKPNLYNFNRFNLSTSMFLQLLTKKLLRKIG